MDGWYSMEDVMLYSKTIANKRYNNPSSPLNAIAGWGGVMRGSNKWCKMSHRDVNARRILSCSGRVRCSPQSPGVKGSGGFLQRLASAWCASRSGSQSVGMLGAVEDGLTDSVPPFPPVFFFFFFLSWLLAFGCPLSIRRQAGKCHGWEWAMVFSASRGETEEEEVQRRRRWSGGDGDGGGVRGGFGGSKHDGVSCPPTHAPLIPPPPFPSFPLLLILITHTNAREEEEDADPLDRFFVFISALISLLHPSILPLQLRGYHLGITGEKNSDSSHCLRESMKIQTLWRCAITFTHTQQRHFIQNGLLLKYGHFNHMCNN